MAIDGVWVEKFIHYQNTEAKELLKKVKNKVELLLVPDHQETEY
jgi:hypothetical protein